MPRRCANWILSLLSLPLISCSALLPQQNVKTPSPTQATLTTISVAPSTTSVNVSADILFVATGNYSDGTTKNLTSTAQWNSSNSAVASVNATGTATGMGQGTATISATSAGVSGSAMLTVNTTGGGTGSGSGGSAGSGGSSGSGGSIATLTGITILPANPSIPLNTTEALTATGSYSDGSSADITSRVTWVSSSPATASVTTTGEVTAVAAGSTTITATLGGVSQSTVVTVTAPTITSISVGPDGPTLPIGITEQFVATAIYSDGSTADLTAGVAWSSSTASVATIDSTGLASLVGAGTTTITATVGALSDSTTVTVVNAHLTSLTLSPATATMAAGTAQQFTATGTFDDGSTQILPSVQWSSSAQGTLTVDSSGLVTAVAAGTATLNATSGSITGTASITVTSATLVSLAIAPLNSTMPTGATKQFTATGSFSDSSTQDMTTLVLWSSSNLSTASINAAGLVNSFTTGNTTIQASLGSAVQSTALTVSTVGLQSIAITPANPTIAKGTFVKFTATGTYSDGSTALLNNVAWKSSKPQLANVRSSGIARGKKAGSVTISALAFGVTGSTSLTVGTGVLVSIQVTPINPSVAAGTKLQFTATGTFSDGTTQDVTLNSHWSSSVAAVATIANAPSQGGLASTNTAGATTIGANSGGIANTTSLSVN